MNLADEIVARKRKDEIEAQSRAFNLIKYGDELINKALTEEQRKALHVQPVKNSKSYQFVYNKVLYLFGPDDGGETWFIIRTVHIYRQGIPHEDLWDELLRALGGAS